MDIVAIVLLVGSVSFMGLYGWWQYKKVRAMDEALLEMLETIQEACHEELEKIKNEVEQGIAVEEAKHEVKH